MGEDAGPPVTSDARRPSEAQLDWVLATLGGATPLREDELTARFAPAFLQEVPADKLRAVLEQTRAALAPITFARFEGEPTAHALVAVVRARAGSWRVRLHVESAAPNKIDGLLLQPAPDLDPAATSWSEVTDALRAAAPRVAWLAADVTDGACAKIGGAHESTAMPMGSAFKLYILAALASEIADGKRHWSDTLPIRADRKSLPSGDLQSEPAGKVFSLETFAEKMISISDNTATDHLLFALGRERVEREVKASGHHDASQMVPFLSTRELFALKLAATEAERRAYVAANVPEKRRKLAELSKRDLSGALAAAAEWKTPRDIDALEWSASPEDTCRVLAALKKRWDAPVNAPLRAILSKNPGLPDTEGAFRYIGFKGGSEPGVLTTSFVLQRAKDDRWTVLAIAMADGDHAIDEAKALAAIARARAFAGK